MKLLAAAFLGAVLAVGGITGLAMSQHGTPAAAAVAGDVNCDGHADPVDATLVLQLEAGLIDVLPCAAEADVSGDGIVTVVDATLILQFAAGLIDGFPAPGITPTRPPSATLTRTPTRTLTLTPTPTLTPALAATAIASPTAAPTPTLAEAPTTAPTDTPTAAPTASPPTAATATPSPTLTATPTTDPLTRRPRAYWLPCVGGASCAAPVLYPEVTCQTANGYRNCVSPDWNMNCQIFNATDSVDCLDSDGTASCDALRYTTSSWCVGAVWYGGCIEHGNAPPYYVHCWRADTLGSEVVNCNVANNKWNCAWNDVAFSCIYEEVPGTVRSVWTCQRGASPPTPTPTPTATPPAALLRSPSVYWIDCMTPGLCLVFSPGVDCEIYSISGGRFDWKLSCTATVGGWDMTCAGDFGAITHTTCLHSQDRRVQCSGGSGAGSCAIEGSLAISCTASTKSASRMVDCEKDDTLGSSTLSCTSTVNTYQCSWVGVLSFSCTYQNGLPSLWNCTQGEPAGLGTAAKLAQSAVVMAEHWAEHFPHDNRTRFRDNCDCLKDKRSAWRFTYAHR